MPADPETTAPAWVKAWGEMLAEASAIRGEYYGTRYARSLTTRQLKEMWDRYDGADDSIGDERLCGEAIHAVLNERGEGKYCAV